MSLSHVWVVGIALMALHSGVARKSPYIIESETKDACTHAEAEQSADVCRHEQRDPAARPVRYLWPALSSLWQAGER
jgi:hypothetical protein